MYVPAVCKPGSAKLCAAVHFGDIIACGLFLGNSGDQKIQPLSETAWKTLELSWETTETLVGIIQIEAEKAEAFLELT